jgi:NCAIR mutase (PurE)-related protein
VSDHAAARTESAAELHLDHDRRARTGIAEAVYAPGKSVEQCAVAVAELLADGDVGPVLLTRADADQAAAAAARNPGPVVATYGDRSRGELRTLIWRPMAPRPGRVLVLTAGTGDLPVARDATAVLEAYGVAATLVPDVGVAGLHRVLGQRELIAEADVVIVVAGMEGALPSVVAGLTPAPVIGVPTSTGYGAALDGVTALLAMMASCSPGITVVGIDNGFGAGCAAIRFLNKREER